jgi:hypothetical protein
MRRRAIILVVFGSAANCEFNVNLSVLQRAVVNKNLMGSFDPNNYQKYLRMKIKEIMNKIISSKNPKTVITLSLSS